MVTATTPSAATDAIKRPPSQVRIGRAPAGGR